MNSWRQPVVFSILLTLSAGWTPVVLGAKPPGNSLRLAGKHPRLFFSAEELAELRLKLKTPYFAKRWVLLLQYVDKTPFVQNTDSRGMESNPALMAEAFAALITQEPRYIEKAKKQILEVASWDSKAWRGEVKSPCKVAGLGLGHFAQAMAVAYDWLYPFLSEEERKTVRTAIQEKAFKTYKEGVDRNSSDEYWLNITNNWCPVIHGGVGVAALATLGEAPEAEWVLEQTRGRFKNYLNPFYKDGGCLEGVMYGIYGVTFLTVFAEALDHVMGTDDGIFAHPGIKNFGSFIRCFTGPDRSWVNFSDCQPTIDLSGDLYVLVGRYGDKALDAYWQHYNPHWRVEPWEFIFRPTWPDPDPKLDVTEDWKVFPEANWAAMRSDRLFLAFKSGNVGSGHKQLDLNSFLIVLDGERLTTTAPYGKVETIDHSTILVNGKGQTKDSTGTIVQSGKKKNLLFVTGEASKAYGADLTGFIRTAFLVPDRFVVIADVLQGKPGNRYEWKLQTTETPVLDAEMPKARIPGKKAALLAQVILPDKATLKVGKTFGPCLSVDMTATAAEASYFVLLAPEKEAITAKATSDGVRVTDGGVTYTFTRTAKGWVCPGTGKGNP